MSLRKTLLVMLAAVMLAFAAIALAGCAQGASEPQEGPAQEFAVEAVDEAGSAADTSSDAGIATPSTAGALQVVGSQLCGQDGSPVQLRGVSTHGLAWFPQYVNQQLFDELRTDWNANVVRLAMYTGESGGYCTGGDQQQLYDLVRSGVDYAAQADLYAIVDWHILSDGNPLANADAAADFFARMSADLAQSDNVIYEICNEPNGGTTWQDVNAYAERIIPAIRANDPDAVVIVGTPTWSQDVDKAAASPLDFPNVMYALHFYAATHQQDLRDRMATAVEGGLPVFVSEFGICDASGNGQLDYASADAWVQLMDQLNVSYVCWNLSNKDEASALFKPNCAKSSGFTADDLSAEGTWLWGVLHGEIPEAVSAGADAGSPANSASGNRDVASAGAASGDASSELSGNTGAIAWTAEQVNSWQADGRTFEQYQVTVTNNSGTGVSAWTVSIPLGGSVQLSDGWNGTYSVEDGTVTVSSASYNGELAPWASASDIGFIVSR